MTPKTLLSMEEFERLPDDGMQHELNEGEVVSMPPPMPEHGWLQAKLISNLLGFVITNGLGRVYGDVGFRLADGTLRAPDVAFIRTARLQPASKYFEGAPDIAVEIVSPGDDASDLDEKVRQYLAAGAVFVWVFYPKTKKVYVHGHDSVKVPEIDGVLEAPGLLPGFQLPVRAIFE